MNMEQFALAQNGIFGLFTEDYRQQVIESVREDKNQKLSIVFEESVGKYYVVYTPAKYLYFFEINTALLTDIQRNFIYYNSEYWTDFHSARLNETNAFVDRITLQEIEMYYHFFKDTTIEANIMFARLNEQTNISRYYVNVFSREYAVIRYFNRMYWIRFESATESLIRTFGRAERLWNFEEFLPKELPHFMNRGRPKQVSTVQTNDGAVINGSVTALGDFSGRDSFKIYT